ncbi:hypothetical protein [Mycobacteroides abscessus]|uniref:hypothetical protein n=1 Tax=Mycobacteroides abscessus TaxID=36809 RepID=UPI0009A62C20|nr:hypothetical protein [Mycobacteroides abscessus]SLH42465.1 Uncharacterised protein [Mycobacteroides abscessus subsp. abscessus]
MTEAREFLILALELGIVAAMKASDGWVSDVEPSEEGEVSTSIRVDGVIDLAALAAEVDKALGGLTRERRKILASGVILSADAEGWEGYATRQSRFVSGWTVTE